MSSFIRRPVRSALAVVVSGMILMGAVLTQPAGAATYAQKAERRLLNQERKPRARPGLSFSWRLNKIAKQHSRAMARGDDLFHNPRLANQVSSRMRWNRIAENVGVGPDFTPVDEALGVLHRAFMDSTAHRRNILMRSVRKVGVGIVRSGGKVWITVVFVG